MKILSLCLLVPLICIAKSATDININNDNEKFIEQFLFIDSPEDDNIAEESEHILIADQISSNYSTIFTRYQQYYKNLKVVGRSIVTQEDKENPENKIIYTGMLAKNLSLPIEQKYLNDDFREQITDFAEKNFQNMLSTSNQTFYDADSQPVIWIDEQNQNPTLAYMINFHYKKDNQQSSWPHYIIEAKNHKIIHYWNNIQTLHNISGPGGNTKTGIYEYGTTNFPTIKATKKNEYCYLANNKIQVISAQNSWNLNNLTSLYVTPVNHHCNDNNVNNTNGAFSPANDAYIFSNITLNMYKNWYNQHILTDRNGTSKTLKLFINGGKKYENAFWNGNYFVFGDGNNSYYPLVSLAIISHELAHAFTETHSNLLYFNQSGAINEAFSDMSAIAAEYYMLQNYNEAYQYIYKTPNINWLIGDRISKGKFAMRSMKDPHLYGDADCDQSGAECHITWQKILDKSQQVPLKSRQSYIVHSGSGVFNRAFFNMINNFNGDIQTVFGIMVIANTTRWTATSNFNTAACGVKQVAKNLGYDVNKVQQAFTEVHITPSC